MKKGFILILPLFFLALTASSQTTVFNGVANNSTDNTAALNAAFQNYTTVIIPSGSNYYLIAGTVNIPTGKTLQFNSGGKFNVIGNLIGNQTVITAGEFEIFKKTSNINGTWTTNYIYAIWTGAVGNGATDDFASLNLFFKLLGIVSNTESRLGVNKQYYIKNQILQDVTKEINLDGRGSRIFRKYADITSDEGTLQFNGVISVEKTISQNISGGQLNIIVNNSSGLSKDMGVEILSNELYGKEYMGNDYWHFHYKGLVSKIKSISGNTLTLKDTVPFNFNASDIYAVRFYITIPVTVKNLKFGAENISGSSKMSQFRISQLFDVVLDNITFDPLGYAGLLSKSIYNGYFNKITCIEPVTGGNNSLFGVYGIIPDLNVNCTYDSLHTQSVTHGIAFTNEPSYKVVVKNSYFRASWLGSNAVDSHASHWVKFENDTIYGAQGNWGTFIFENCEMHEIYNSDNSNIWNEREGASRGNLEVYFNDCNFYTNYNVNTSATLFYRMNSIGISTNKYSVKNSDFYLENNTSYLFNAASPGSATEIKPFLVENNNFYGNGTLWLPREFNTTPTTQGGVFTFKNNKYSLVYWSNPPLDQFQTIDILNNTPVNSNTSDFWVNWNGPAGNVNFKNNSFVGACFWMMDCTGNILFDNNDIYNDQLKSSSGYKDRNYISGNSNLVFTNNNLHNTYWTITGNNNVSNNISNGVTQPQELTGSWQNVYTNGNFIETGITMAGLSNYTIISRAKMDDNSTNAIQNIVSSPVLKLSLGFNPSGTAPYFKPIIRNVNGSYVSPTLSRFYMDKQWHTYVFIMQNGILKGYMDGIAMLSYDATSVYSQMYATGTLKVGGSSSSEKWRGSMQIFAIFNRALSLSEAKSFSENPNITLSGEIYKLADGEVANNNIVGGYWKFDEMSGTTAYDNSGNNNNGTLVNGPNFTTGMFGNSLNFDGTNDMVDCGNSATLDMGTDDFSLATWVKMGSSQNSYPTIISKGGTSSTTAGYWVYLYGSKIRFTLGDGTQRISASSETINILDNTWHHIAVAVDRNGNAVFYLDGVIAGTYDVSSFNGKNISNASRALNIGTTGSSNSYLNGFLDEVKIYKKALNQTEVTELASTSQQNDYISYWAFDETSGTTAADSGSYEYNGTLENGPIWNTGINNNALGFDGINDKVNCGTGEGLEMGTDDWSISTWVKMGSSQNSYPTIISKGGTSSTTAGYWFYISGSKLRFYFSDGTQRMSTASETISILDNSWHHLAVTVDRNGDVIFYVDGINAGTYDVSSFSGKDISNPSRILNIGTAGSTKTFLNGMIDEVMLYRRALNSEEVSLLANNAQNYNLISHWAFDESTGSVAFDSSTYVVNDGTLTNGPIRENGIKGNSLGFDGIDDRVECGTDTVMGMGTGDFSVSAWVKMGPDQLNLPTIVSKGGTSSSNAGYWFFIYGSKLRFYFGDGSDRLATYSETVNIFDNSWHNLAVTVDRDGEAVFYIDGINAGSYDISSFNGKDISNPTCLLTVGSAGTSSSTFLNGNIDDVRIYNTVLTQTEITSLADVPQNYSPLLGSDETQQNIHFINAFPNPFRENMILRISSPEDQIVSAYIFDMKGGVVKSYNNLELFTGVNKLLWDGRNDNSAFVNPGTYFVRVITNSKVDNLTIIKMQ